MVGGVGAQESRPFVGRADELRLLAEQVNEVRAGVSRLVLIEGSPGIGKTSLLRRFLAGYVDLTLVGVGGDEDEIAVPYGVVTQILRQACQLTGGYPGNGARVESWAEPGGAGAELLHALAGLGHGGPVVLIVDDAQWADTPSLQALSFAIRRLQRDPVLAVVMAEDDACNVPDGLRRLASERGVAMRLEGLSCDDLAALTFRVTGENPTPRARQRLWEHTSGNPLHLMSLLEELGPIVLRNKHLVLPAPRSYSTVALSRVAKCSEAARALIQASAVLGKQCSVASAADVAALEQPVEAFDEAVAAGILEATEGATGPMVRFSHRLLGAAVYENLRPARRCELHARAAKVTAGVTSLDHRIAATLIADPGLAADVAAHARREMASGAAGAAARYFVAAARLTRDRHERDRFLLDGIEQLLVGGDVAQATNLINEADSLPDSARASYLRGQLAIMTGRRSVAEEQLLDAWHRCGSSCDEELGARVSLLLAQLCTIEHRVAEAVEWAGRALGGSRSVGHRALVLGILVPCLGAVGRCEEGLALTAGLAEGAAAAISPHEVDLVTRRALVRMWTDELAAARDDLVAVVDATRSRPASASAVIALAFLAEVEYRLGLWDDSIANGALAAELADDSEQCFLAPFAHAGATWALSARGDWPAAAAHVRAAASAAKQLRDPSSVTCAAMAAVQFAFARGDQAAVIDAAGPLVELEEHVPLGEPSIHPWRALYVDALIATGRLDEADDALGALESLAERRNRRSSLAAKARVRGTLEAARGNADEARASFESGLRQCEYVAAPFERALLELAYGRFLRRAGERRMAASQLGEAHRAFSRLGANPFVDRCQGELAACGLSPRARSTKEPAPGLTPQELAVARLVSAGASNREAATQLVVSVKTVEYHLGNVFTKFGISSRHQIAGRLQD